MLEEAYGYGLTPQEATELTFSQMAYFINANRKKEMEKYKILARICYSAGIVASSTFAKRKPKFEDLFNFPEDKNNSSNSDLIKAQMLYWAQNINRLDRKSRKGENK